MITLCIAGAMKGSKLDKLQMIVTAVILDSIYILPMIF
jgi:hypothetical protein